MRACKCVLVSEGSNENNAEFTPADDEVTSLSSKEESSPNIECFEESSPKIESFDGHKEGEEVRFYSGEGEILATRGEIHPDELMCASKKISNCTKGGLRAGGYSYSDPTLYKNWRKSNPKIYCGQGNPILFNAVSNIVRKEKSVSPNTRKGHGFPWVVMKDCSSLSTRAEVNRTLNRETLFKRESNGFLAHEKDRTFGTDFSISSSLETNFSCQSFSEAGT